MKETIMFLIKFTNIGEQRTTTYLLQFFKEEEIVGKVRHNEVMAMEK